MTATDSGVGTRILHVYIDQPTVAAALAAAFTGRGWAASGEQGVGYVTEVSTQGAVTGAVSPIGVDNGVSAWGSIWSGMDVTLMSVEQP